MEINNKPAQINSYYPTHGGNLNEEAQRLGIQIDQLLDASASVVPFAPPRALHRCLSKLLTNNYLRHYPDCHHTKLRKAIGEWHGVDMAMVLPGNGAAELFTWAARDSALIGLSGLPSPGFADYSRALRCWDAPFIHLPLPVNCASKTPQPFPIQAETKILWITNPHNPTGQLWSRESIEPLLKKYRLVICDEAFLPLVPNGEKESLIPLVANHPNLVVIRSLTKLFGLAGLRLGYAIGAPERMKEWKDLRDPWPLNTFAVSAGVMLMSDKHALTNWISKVHKWIKKEMPWIESKLSNIPDIIPLPSSTNFLLIKGVVPLTPLREKLAQRHVLLRDCRSFVGLGEFYLRISLQTRAGNRRIINALNAIIN